MDPIRPDRPSDSASENGGSPVVRRLDSWKAIAAYLQRDVATVRRWEKREGLPVHRHQHDKLGSVYADTDEVDAWYRSRRRAATPAETTAPVPATLPAAATLATLATSDPGRARRWGLALPLAAFAAAVALVSGIWLGSRAWNSTDEELRFLLTSTESVSVTSLAVSPDGNFIAMAGATAGNPDTLWLRALKSTELIALPHTEGAELPFWSPDSRHVGFSAQGQLRRIDVSTGQSAVIASVSAPFGATWNKDDDIVFAAGYGSLLRIHATGGEVTPVTVTSTRGEFHRWPDFLPDGQSLVFFIDSRDADREGVYVARLDHPEPRRILDLKSNAIPTADGRLLFVRNGRLVSQNFDATSLQLSGDETIEVDQVLQQRALAQKGDFSISRTGVLAYRSGTVALRPLVWMNRRGEVLGTLGESAHYAAPVLSQNQRRVAVVRFDTEARPFAAAIWTIDTATGSTTRLTADQRPAVSPVWSPDSAQIMYAVVRGEQNDLVRRAAHGVAADDVVYQAGDNPLLDSWSADGRFLFYSVFSNGTGFDTWALPLFGSRKPFPVLRNQHWEAQSQLSPDGRLLSYTSNQTGRPEVYLTRFPSRDGTWPISSGGGGDARWRRDGRELTYIAANGKLMSVSIGPAPTYARGVPQPLFDTRIRNLWEDMRNHYDISDDGERFLFTVPIDDARLTPFTVAVRWSASAR